MTARKPIPNAPDGIGLRQRALAGGKWRVWWEPTTNERKAGAKPVELDPDRPSWSIRQAKDLKAQASGKAPRRRPTDSTGRTVTALVDAYLRSSKFRKLAAATQAGYKVDFRRIEARWGQTMARRVTRPDVYAWYEQVQADTPTYATALVRALSVLMSHAELIGWRDPNTNPCFRLSLSGADRRKRFATWPEFDALIASAQLLGLNNMAAAIALAVFAAQRQKDVIEARTGAFLAARIPGQDDPVLIWNLVRSKRGNAGSIPLHPEATKLVQPCMAGRGPSDRLLTDDRTGQPFTRTVFANRWEEIRTRAAQGPSQADLHAHYKGTAPIADAALHAQPQLLTDPLQFRDLRRTFGVWARGGGAGRDDIGDVLGNMAGTDAVLGEIYMPAQLVTSLRAVQAITRPGQDTERKEA